MQQGEKRPPPNGDDPPGGPNPPKRPAPTFKQIAEAFNLVIVYLQVVLQYIRSQDPDTRPIPLPMVYPGSVHAVPQATPAAAPPAPTLTPVGSPPTTPEAALMAALIPMTPGEDGNTNDQQPAPAVEAARLPIISADEPEEQQTDAPAPEPVQQSNDDDAPESPDSGDDAPTTQPEWKGTFLTSIGHAPPTPPDVTSTFLASSVEAASGALAVEGSQQSIEEIPSGDEDDEDSHRPDHPPDTLPPESQAPDQPEDTLPPEGSQPPQNTRPPDNGPPYTRRQWALRRDDD